MSRILFKVLIAVSALFAANAAHAIGPSFPCSKAVGRPIGELICASPDLSKLDLEFAQAYYALRFQVGPSGQKALEVQAINFENKAIADCQIPTSDPAPPLTPTISDCITREYTGQRQAWVALLNGPALEEVNLPVEQLLAVQTDLKTLGLLPASSTIDGVFGDATRDAIIDWQSLKGENVTGFMSGDDAFELAAQANDDPLAKFSQWYAYSPHTNSCFIPDPSGGPVAMGLILFNEQIPYSIQTQNLPDGSPEAMKIVYPWLGDPNHSDYFFATESSCLGYRNHLMQLGLEPVPH